MSEALNIFLPAAVLLLGILAVARFTGLDLRRHATPRR